MRYISILLALCAASCSSPETETIVVYSPHGADILSVYEERFEQTYPEYDVQWLDMGSQEVYTRISQARNRPVADVWWGGPSFFFMQAAEEDLLAPYEPTWSESIEPGSKDPAHHWYGTHDTPLSIMFNDRHYTPSEVPQTWDALLDPEWDQKITIREPLPSGTMRTFIGAMILRQGGVDAGIAWLKRLHHATRDYTQSPQLLFDRIKRNEELLTVWIMPDAVLQRELHGYPFGFYIPPQTPVLVEAVAVVKNAPNPTGAALFYEFVTTPESLSQQAHDYAKVPARTDVDPSLLPEWMRDLEIDPMNIDWLDFKQHEKEWIDRWEAEVRRTR